MNESSIVNNSTYHYSLSNRIRLSSQHGQYIENGDETEDETEKVSHFEWIEDGSDATAAILPVVVVLVGLSHVQFQLVLGRHVGRTVAAEELCFSLFWFFSFFKPAFTLGLLGLVRSSWVQLGCD